MIVHACATRECVYIPCWYREFEIAYPVFIVIVYGCYYGMRINLGVVCVSTVQFLLLD